MKDNVQSSELVIENERLLAQKQELERELAGLERIGYDLARSTNLAEALKITITEAKRVLQADTVVIYAYNERQGQFMRPPYTTGLAYPEQFEARDFLPQTERLTAKMIQSGSAIITQILDSGGFDYTEVPFVEARGFDLNARRELRLGDQDIAFLQEQGIHSSVGLPLRAGNDLLGVLYVSYWRHHDFTPDELRTLGRLAQHAALAIQRANTYQEIAVLHEAGKVLTSQTEMRAVLQKLFEYGQSMLGAELIVLFPYHTATDEFELPPVVSGELSHPPAENYFIRPDDIVFKIIQQDHPHFARDAQTDELLGGSDPARRATRFVGRERILSAAAVPLRAEDEIVGVVFFDYRVRQRFGSHQQQLIQTFAHYAAAAIQRARLLGRREDELRAIAEIDQALTGGSLPEVLDRIIRLACKIIEAKIGNIMLVEESGEYINLVSLGEMWPAKTPRRFRIDEMGVVGWVAQHKRPARIGDVHVAEWQDIYVEAVPGVQSELAAPILNEQGELVGIINLESRTRNAFSADDERLLVALAEQAYIAIRNQRLFTAEQRARQAAERLTMHLQAAAEIARSATAVSHLGELLWYVVDLVKSRFGFYQVGIYLVDEQREYAVLPAATIETGSQLLEKRHQLKVGEQGIVGHVIRTGQPHIASDVARDPWHYKNERLPLTRSEMALPFKVGDLVIGALDIQSREVNAFVEDDVAVLKIVSDQLAVAIENIRLLEEKHRTQQVRQILSEVDHLIVTESLAPDGEQTSPLEKVLQLILDRGLTAVGAPTGHIVLYDKARGDLYTAVCSSPDQKGLRQQLSEGIIGKAARERQTQRVADVTKLPWDAIYLPVAPETRSELAVPLLRGERLVGVFNAESWEPGAFGSNEQMLLEDLARQAVAAYETAERYQALQTLRELNQLLTSGSDPDEFIRLLLQHACSSLQAEWGNLRLYDSDGQPTLDYIVVTSALEETPEIQVADLQRVKPEAWVTEGIVAWVARKRKAYLSAGDIQNDPKFRNISGLNIHSEMAVPLVVGEELVGVLNLESERVDAFDLEDLERLLDFAVPAAVAVRNARGQEERRQARERFKALNEVGEQIINAPLDKETILAIVLEAGLDRTGAFHAVAWQLDEEGKQLEAVLVRPLAQSDVPRPPILLSENVEDQVALNGQVAIERRPILIDDVDHVPAGIKYRQSNTDEKSILVVPLVVGNAYYGNIEFQHKEVGGFKAEEIELIKGLAAQAANAIRRIEAVKAIQEAEQRATSAEVMSSIGQQAFELAHQLGNDLGLVKSYTKEIAWTLEAQGWVSPVIDENLKRIVNDVRRVLELSTKLKQDLTGLASNEKTELPLSIVSTRRLLEQALTEALPSRSPAIEIKFDLAENVGAVRVVYQQAVNLLRDLISNAVEAMPHGGTLTLQAHNADRFVSLKVMDTGVGIAPDKLSRVFDLSYSTKGSSGFGLWSARRNALANGGDLTVESQLGRGSTFAVGLPRVWSRESEAASMPELKSSDQTLDSKSDSIEKSITTPTSSIISSREAPPREETQASNGSDDTSPASRILVVDEETQASNGSGNTSPAGRILVVDDKERWREVQSRLFKSKGYLVEVASTLEEAQQKLTTSLFHLIILDIRLERATSGFDFLRTLKMSGFLGEMEVIMLTAYGTLDQMREAFRDYEVADFIAKGSGDFDPDEYLQQVNKVINRKVNFNLALEFAPGFVLSDFIDSLELGDHKTALNTKDRVELEFLDLMRRLFATVNRIVVHQAQFSEQGHSLFTVEAYDHTGHTGSFLVQVDDWHVIDEELKKRKAPNEESTNLVPHEILNTRRTVLLGGIVYKLDVLLLVNRSGELDKLKTAYDQLKLLDRQKFEFLAIASHELRQPLTHVHHVLEQTLAGEYGELTEAGLRDKLKLAHDEAHHLVNLIRRLMNVARIEAGMAGAEFSPCDVIGLIQTSLQNLQPEAHRHKLTVKLEPGAQAALMVEIDGVKIKETLDNLLDNAVKYNQPGGSINIACFSQDGEIEIRVSDTGRGIPPDKLDRIFDWFYQVDPSLTRSIEGLGVGLYIVRANVKLHGGRVQVASEVGSGSIFSIFLPLKQK